MTGFVNIWFRASHLLLSHVNVKSTASTYLGAMYE